MGALGGAGTDEFEGVVPSRPKKFQRLLEVIQHAL